MAKTKKGDVTQTWAQIKAEIEGAETDMSKFALNGVKAAGVRVRKAALNVKNLCSQLRKEVSAAKK